MTLYSVPISDSLYERLLNQAQQTNRPIADIVQQTLERNLPEPIELDSALPALLKSELEAMTHLSDATLVTIASGNLSQADHDQLARLNDAQRERSLTESEDAQLDALLSLYDEMLVRRAHAAVLLKSRGFDVSDPTQFHAK